MQLVCTVLQCEVAMLTLPDSAQVGPASHAPLHLSSFGTTACGLSLHRVPGIRVMRCGRLQGLVQLRLQMAEMMFWFFADPGDAQRAHGEQRGDRGVAAARIVAAAAHHTLLRDGRCVSRGQRR